MNAEQAVPGGGQQTDRSDDQPPTSGTERADYLIRRIRYAQVSRPFGRTGAAALLLLPILSVEEIRAADHLLVWSLTGIVAVSLAYSAWRFRSLQDAMEAAPARVWKPAGYVWGFAVLIGLLGVVLAAFPDSNGVAATKVAIVFALLAVVLAGVTMWRSNPRESTDARSLQPSGYESEKKQTPKEEQTAEFSGDVIACSGGGIRAAAFCLGGLQRLRKPSEGAASIYTGARHVYAVSGGGYVAIALHLARLNSRQEVQEELFEPGSPEEDWLRRRSKFLLPSGRERFRGILSLAFGVAVNVTLIGVCIYVAAWYVGWLHNRFGTICGGSDSRPASCLNGGGLATIDTQGTLWLQLPWLILMVGLGSFVLAKVVSKFVTRGRLPWSDVTRWVVVAGVIIGSILAIVPGLIVGLNNATIQNQPTTVVAKAMAATHLATPVSCVNAVEGSFGKQAVLAWERTPDPDQAEAIPFTYGACGDTWTDDALVFAPSGEAAVAPAEGFCSDSFDGPTPSYCDDEGGQGGGFFGVLEAWVSVAVALLAAIRGITGAGGGGGSTRKARLSNFLRRAVLPWAAAVVLVLVAMLILIVQVRNNLVQPQRLERVWPLLVAAGLFLGIRVLTDAALSSLNPFYRERLTETFLVKRDDNQTLADHKPTASALPYHTPTHVHDSAAKGRRFGPELVVCCAANIADPDFIPAQRGCAPFRFQTGQAAGFPRGAIGISDSRLPPGRLKAAQPYSEMSDPEGIDTTLSAAMTTSGAAFSPLVGRMNARTRPYRLLLALGNARLGVWLPNPYVVDDEPVASPSTTANEEATRRPPAKNWVAWIPQRALRPGPWRLFQEAVGTLSVYDGQIYVTDGGHYDNTAIVEALRDRPKRLFVLDASADPPDSLDALGDAIVTARMDLGLVIRPASNSPVDRVRQTFHPRTKEPLQPERGWLHLQVATVEAPETVVCDIWFVKNVLTREPNLELETYWRENPEFPITSTTRQSYGEYDFEAYRLLGYTNTTAMLAEL